MITRGSITKKLGFDPLQIPDVVYEYDDSNVPDLFASLTEEEFAFVGSLLREDRERRRSEKSKSA